MNQAEPGESEAALSSLVRAFPLPPGSNEPAIYADAVSVFGVTIHLVGIQATVGEHTVTGSAGSVSEAPYLRAYMELQERLSIVSCTQSHDADDAGPASDEWRPARSNGVAIGPTFEAAARRARLELVERDRVLRSWYGEGAPERVPDALLAYPPSLRDGYRIQAYTFSASPGAVTAGVFAFPLGQGPLAYGFAAREDVASAVSAALEECLQRLGFLWGEPLPEAPPVASPTPDFHQEHYLYPAHHEELRKWLQGQHAGVRGLLGTLESAGRPRFVEVRPSWLSSRLFVVRALPSGHVPLGFGLAHPLIRRPVPPGFAVHPIV